MIKPEPTGIVVKTHLVEQKHNSFVSCAPPSLSNISLSLQNIQEGNAKIKVFINVCAHSLIGLPTQRQTIDENGQRIEGWRLPISMGELRMVVDKMGNACIAVDCIMNPAIVEDMKADSNQFHFLCDLIIQCAERKFQYTRFGGKVLERNFKLPKKSFPVVPQRVMGSGGNKSPIIEEIQCIKSSSNDDSPPSSEVRIKLFIATTETPEIVPLLDFLTNAADVDASLRKQPRRTLHEMIKSPQLKPCKKNLCESQLLMIPIPLNSCRITVIIAKCCLQRGMSQAELPTIDVSAFLLTLSKTEKNAATECVLPFPVDGHKTSAQYETKSGMLELRMPILQSALDFEHTVDPGTRQWEIQNALRMKINDNDETREADGAPKMESEDQSSGLTYLTDDFGLESIGNNDNDVDDDSSDGPLPEDAFHSQDVLSRHLLQTQKEGEKNAQQRKGAGREGVVVRY